MFLERAITFQCSSDELVGILHSGHGSAKDVGILIVVGGPQYRVGAHRQFVLMARAFSAAGYPVFRFDFRGMGDSSGSPRTFESVDADIRSAIDTFVREQPFLQRIVIFGLCDAASAALMYCPSDERLTGLILANPWVRTQAGEAEAFVRHYFGRRFLQRSFWAKLFSGEFRFLESARGLYSTVRRACRRGASHSLDVDQSFLERMQRGFSAFRGRVLILSSDRDLTAQEFDQLCRSSPGWSELIARSNVERSTIRDADHTFSSSETLNRAMETVLAWLR